MYEYTSIVCTSVVCLLIQNAVNGNILGPQKVVESAGQDAKIKFTSNDSNPFLAANFGLDVGKIFPVPKFITVIVGENGKHKITNTSDSNAKIAAILEKYKDRVFFEGNLTKGQAWFILKRLADSDTNQYMVNIREKSKKHQTFQKFSFQLVVNKEDETSKTTTIKTIQTASVLNTFSSISSIPHTNIPPQPIEAKFTDFEGIGKKTVKSYAPLEKGARRLFRVAIKKAYSMFSSPRIIVTSFKKRKKNITARFQVVFGQKVNQTYAFSFLQKAEGGKKLRGFKITCFNYTDQFRKHPKKTEPATLNIPLILSLVLLATCLLILTVVCCLRFPGQLRSFKRWLWISSEESSIVK